MFQRCGGVGYKYRGQSRVVSVGSRSSGVRVHGVRSEWRGVPGSDFNMGSFGTYHINTPLTHYIDFWVKPPYLFSNENKTDPTSNEKDAEPITVDIRLILNKVAEVDTVHNTAKVLFDVVFYWTDPRLIDWDPGMELPPSIWGPDLFIANGLGGIEQKSTPPPHVLILFQ